MLRHNFAPLILKQNKIKIFANNNQILSTKEEPQSLPKFETKYTLHTHISTSKNDTKIIDRYDDLLRMGFQISKRRASGRFFYHQMVEYFLVKTTSGYPHIGIIPPKHEVIFNFVENYLRIVGRNSSGKKVYFTRRYVRKQLPKEYEIDDYIKIWEEYPLLNSPFTYEEQEEIKTIPEIPILKTDDGKIVCLPLAKDNPTIGIFGKKGRGKTLLKHRLADCVYWKWNKRVFIGNDVVAFQTKSWSMPWDSDRHQFFINLLNQIGEHTRALPCAYLTPNTKDLRKIDFENEIGFKITLPFEDIMENPTPFFEGTKDELGASEKYLKNLIYDDKGRIRPDGLKYCKTLEGIYSLVNEKEWIDVPTDKGLTRQEVFKIDFEKVRGKIYNLLKEIYLSHLFDVNADYSSKWVVDIDGVGYKMYPWDACLFADIVPVLITDELRMNKFFASYQRFIMLDIFNRQSREEIIKRNNIELWYFLDELQSIIKKHQPAREAFTMINKEARMNRMGIVYTSQSIYDIPSDIQLTTDYVVSFQQTSNEATEIAKDFDFLRHQTKDLVKLRKFEAIIAGKELVVYDTEGNREVIDDGSPFRGIIFPSVSQHSAPKEEGI